MASLKISHTLSRSLVRERRWKLREKKASLLPPHSLHLNSAQDFCSLPMPSQPHQAGCMGHMEAESLRIEELRQGVRKALVSNNGLDLTLIDSLQHLGISYHFEDEINTLLHDRSRPQQHDDLFLAALHFRLLRQRGHTASQGSPHDACMCFSSSWDKDGNLKEKLRKDHLGLLSLHEASYLGTRDEEILSKANVFTKKQVERSMSVMDPTIGKDFGHALENPRHRKMEKIEARSFIEKHLKEYGIRTSKIVELAQLDFNMVQRLYQIEIEELERWWRDLGLAKKLSFARDRPLECFLWTAGIFPEPRFSRCRVEVAKVVAILLVIDDIYDTYGTEKELLLFTDAVHSWGVDATENLPEYMKIGYMAIYNTTNEIGRSILIDHGVNAIPYLRKTWIDLCEAFLLEGKRFKSGVPTLDDYMSISVTTAGTYMALIHGFFLMGTQISKESLNFVNSSPNLFTNSGRILRLWDDLGTTEDEQLKGDDASSLNCYMKHNTDTSEADARNHVRVLIDQTWQELNRDALIKATPLPQSMIEASLNLARTSQAIYQHGDDKRAPSVGDNVEYLLKRPIITQDHGFFSNKPKFASK